MSDPVASASGRPLDLIIDGPRLNRDLDGDLEDRTLTVIELSAAPIGGHLVGDRGVARPDPGDRALGHDAYRQRFSALVATTISSRSPLLSAGVSLSISAS